MSAAERKISVSLTWLECDGPRFLVQFSGPAAGPQFESREYSFLTEAIGYVQECMVSALQGQPTPQPGPRSMEDLN